MSGVMLEEAHVRHMCTKFMGQRRGGVSIRRQRIRMDQAEETVGTNAKRHAKSWVPATLGWSLGRYRKSSGLMRLSFTSWAKVGRGA